MEYTVQYSVTLELKKWNEMVRLPKSVFEIKRLFIIVPSTHR
jgi:hypothetical protein